MMEHLRDFMEICIFGTWSCMEFYVRWESIGYVVLVYVTRCGSGMRRPASVAPFFKAIPPFIINALAGSDYISQTSNQSTDRLYKGFMVCSKVKPVQTNSGLVHSWSEVFG